MFGNFDFNATPLTPPGTKIVLHKKPDKRSSFAFHGLDICYIGPSLEHYICVKCYIPSMNGIRDADTVQFFPKNILMPATTTIDYLNQAATNILAILQNPPSSFPSLEAGHPTKDAIEK